MSILAALLAAALLAAGCGDDDASDSASDDSTETTETTPDDETSDDVVAGEEASPEKDLVDTAVAGGNFTTLIAATKAADLEGTLRGEGPFTLFAPTDAAFRKLPAGTVANLLKPENKQQLVDILTYHVVPDAAVMSSDLTDGQKVETVQGDTLTISLDDGVKVNNATVTSPDIETANGVIHVIDTVLLPPT